MVFKKIIPQIIGYFDWYQFSNWML